MEVTKFMQSDFYLNYLDDLDEKMPVKIDRVSTVHDIVIKIMMDWLSHASLTPSDLKWLIDSHRVETIDYIVKKHEVYLEPDGGEDNIVNLPPKVNFPIGHLIEYYLLLERPGDVLDHIKKVRIPGPVKYAREIKNIFSYVHVNWA